MHGAVYYDSKYGSTRQYAEWIGEATGLRVHSIDDGPPDPAEYDYLVVGSPVIYFRLSARRWVKRHAAGILSRPTLLFTVSGAPAGPKLDGWIAKSLPGRVVDHVDHVALQGRQRPAELTRFDRYMLKVGAMFNRDPQARQEELQGFDYVDRSSIAAVVSWVHEREAAAPTSTA